MINREEFEYKLINGTFSEDELSSLKYLDIEVDEETYKDLHIIDEIEESDLARWTRAASYVFSYKDNFFRVDYDEGLTEYQNNCNFSQPYKVKKVERQITVVDWICEEDV